MAVDPRLRADLLNKLDIADRQLRRRAAARRLELPMSSDEAIYTIAAEAELDLSKYLTSRGDAPSSPARFRLASRVEYRRARRTINDGQARSASDEACSRRGVCASTRSEFQQACSQISTGARQSEWR